MAKKKLPITIFEFVWYLICGLVVVWGATYSVLGVVAKYSDVEPLEEFDASFEKLFGLNLFFWGLLIIAIAVVAAVVVLLVNAKKFDRASEREQRRSARLSALRKENNKVVAEQEPVEVFVTEELPVEEVLPEETPVEEVAIEPVSEETPVEEKAN